MSSDIAAIATLAYAILAVAFMISLSVLGGTLFLAWLELEDYCKEREREDNEEWLRQQVSDDYRDVF